MASIVVIIAIVIFAAGAAAGAIFLVSLGVRREELDFSLTSQAPDRVSQAARRVTGLWVRQPADAYHTAGRRYGTFVSPVLSQAGPDAGGPGRAGRPA